MRDSGFEFTRHGRSARTALALLAVWGLILLALLVFEASVVLVGIIAIFTIPAALDFALNPSAGMALSADGVRWYSGKRSAELHFDEIDQFRFDRRLDFSVRVSAVLREPAGKRIRLPYECVPPHRELEEALQARGQIVTRHHFSLF